MMRPVPMGATLHQRHTTGTTLQEGFTSIALKYLDCFLRCHFLFSTILFPLLKQSSSIGAKLLCLSEVCLLILQLGLSVCLGTLLFANILIHSVQHLLTLIS